MPKPESKPLTFRDFQAMVTHGLVGMTTKEIRKAGTTRRLDEWLEDLCAEVLQHAKDVET